MKNTFEVHIAAPVLNEQLTTLVRETLHDLGLPKTKYFTGVHNEKPITPDSGNGHDLEHPGTMSTVKVQSIEEAVNLVRTGMTRLRELGIEGTNFEIERVMVPEDDSVSSFSLEDSLAEFKDVPNAPTFENHVLYKGTNAELPSIQQIIDLIKSVIGQEVNQIVDFARVREEEIDSSTIISRVATIYQPSHSAAAETDAVMRNAIKALRFVKNPRDPRIVTEQVLTVGEYK